MISHCDRCGTIIHLESDNWTCCDTCGDNLCLECAGKSDDDDRCQKCQEVDEAWKEYCGATK